MSTILLVTDLFCSVFPAWNMMKLQKNEMEKFNIIKETLPAIEDNISVDIEDEGLDNTDISTDLYYELVRIVDGNKKGLEAIIDKARKSERWIKYTIRYMTTPNVEKIPCNNKEKELVNGIADYLIPGIGKIYEDARIANINEYDVKHLICDNSLFVLDKNDIASRFNTEMVEKAKAKMIHNDNDIEEVIEIVEENNNDNFDQSTNSENENINHMNGRYDENGYYHPIFTKTPDQIKEEINSIPIKDPGMDEKLFNKYNNVFNPFLVASGRKYYFNSDSFGNSFINIINGDYQIASYMIDDGTIMGGENVSIMGTYFNNNGVMDNIFVDIGKHPYTVSKILESPLYIMTPEEVALVTSDMFADQSIYRFVDFSNSQFVDHVDKNALGVSLSSVMKINDEEARLRFYSFTDPYNFTLVSDYKCKSPIPGVTSGIIISGIKYIISGNTVTKLIGDKGTRYQF